MTIRSNALFIAAVAACASLAGTARATTVNFDCRMPANSGSGALQTFIEGQPSGTVVNVLGTCLGDVNLFLSAFTLQGDAVVGGTIAGHVFVSATSDSVSNLTINGASLSDSSGGVTAYGSGVTGLVSNCIIENWAFVNVGVYNGATLLLSDDTLENSAGAGLNVDAAVVQMSGGTIEGAGGGNAGANLFEGANVQFSSTLIENNTGSGIAAHEGAIVHLGSQGSPDPSQAVEIKGNQQGGVGVGDSSQLFVNNANIHDNMGGSALAIVHGSADITVGTISAPAGVTQPTILLARGGLQLNGPSLTITGTGTSGSNVIYGVSNSSIEMIDATVTQSDVNDASIIVDDGSALVSLGGNTITNGAGSGTAISVINGSTFHQHIASQFGAPAAADTITGAGTVQMQSNMELGTGPSTPSSWTGAINVAQNSSFRMDGGMTITGTVTLGQGSNGFFNKTTTGNNVVTGGVSCTGTGTAHVVGNAAVTKTGGASAVTLVTTGVGCYAF